MNDFKKRPSPPTNAYTWYSVCSAHQEYNEKCPRCNAGDWVNDELEDWTYEESWAYDFYPDILAQGNV